MKTTIDLQERVPESYEKLEGGEAARYIAAVDYEQNSDYSLFAEEIDKKYGIAGKRILEIGSGPGLLCFELAKRGANLVIGLDGSDDMIKASKRHASYYAQMTNMQFCKSDIYSTPFESSQFDLVVSQNSFHHFSQPEQALIEMLRVTKIGGYIYIADYRRDASPTLMEKRLAETKPEIQEDLLNTFRASFTKKELRDMIARVDANVSCQVANASNPLNILERAAQYIKHDPVPHYKDYRLALRAEIRKLG